MNIKASGRSALILATGLFVCFAGPSHAAAANANDTAAASKSESATAGKPVAQSSHHRKRTAHRSTDRAASKSTEAEKRAPTEVADAGAVSSSAIPPSVANAELTWNDTPADHARAMSAKANAALLLAAADKPDDAQPVADAESSSAEASSSDQLNDLDRALQQSPPPAQTVAMASAKAAPAAPVLASNESSTWDQTSLIGKIFIGFGALLTMASAARMFMA